MEIGGFYPKPYTPRFRIEGLGFTGSGMRVWDEGLLLEQGVPNMLNVSIGRPFKIVSCCPPQV